MSWSASAGVSSCRLLTVETDAIEMAEVRIASASSRPYGLEMTAPRVRSSTRSSLVTFQSPEVICRVCWPVVKVVEVELPPVVCAARTR
jgi:hypothetical protein